MQEQIGGSGESGTQRPPAQTSAAAQAGTHGETPSDDSGQPRSRPRAPTQLLTTNVRIAPSCHALGPGGM